jgi:hypothetical protein
VEPAADEEDEPEPPVAVEEAEAEDEPEPVAVAVAELLELSVAEAEEEELVELAEVAVSIGGTEMGWPAEEHWATTALETEIWSETAQAFCTQGVMVLTSWGFWQWQAKSVRDEQPSVVRAVTKQLSEQEGTSGS